MNRNQNDNYGRNSAQWEEDPYERGFAHKLYEDEYEPPLVEYPEYEEEQYLPYEPEPTESPRGYRRPVRKKKKHTGRKILISLLIILILIPALLLGTLWVLAKPPMDQEDGRISGSSTILLAGTDESGDRTDTIMLLNINRSEGRISLMSIPRDTRVNSSYSPQKINAAYGMNGGGEEGMDALMDYVGECIGFRPDGYVLVELDVFIDLVDLFGGVEFDVPMDMYYEDPTQDLYINLQKGLQTLNGNQAMGLVRYRYGYADADIGRVSVQRDFIMAALSQWASLKNIPKLPQALNLILDNSVTDLNTANLTWLAQSVLQCGTDDMQMLTIPHYLSGQYVIIDADEDYLNCINTYFNPYEKDITWEDLNIAY